MRKQNILKLINTLISMLKKGVGLIVGIIFILFAFSTALINFESVAIKGGKIAVA